MIKVIPFIYEDYDDLCANTYVLIDDLKRCVVIDPSKDNENLVNYLKRNKLELKGILLTHGHIDHFKGIQRLLNFKKVEVFISFDEEEVIKNPYNNGSIYINGESYSFSGPFSYLKNKDVINIINCEIVALATPYHTIGSMSYYIKDIACIFTGDSLFKNSIGRTDFPTGNKKQLLPTLERLLSLPGDTKVYPGHGKNTLIKNEVNIIKFI